MANKRPASNANKDDTCLKKCSEKKKLLKILFFGAVILIEVLGCALIAVGLWLRLSPSLKKLAEERSLGLASSHLTIGLFAIGGVIVFIALVGIFGVVKEIRWILIMFSICLFISFAGLVGIGVYGLVEKEKLILEIKNKFEEELDSYDKENEENQVITNLIQSVFKCCGMHSAADYTRRSIKEPSSCPSNDLSDTGCFEVLDDQLGNYFIVLACVAIGVGIIMLLGMIFSMLLFFVIRKSDNN